ncbi:MAG TPA: ATP-binding cassette domain-containing protein [Dongiaceae bacterium]|nr:ATP-binding cassette domain-containing protein [Dongiaceae bacterium]
MLELDFSLRRGDFQLQAQHNLHHPVTGILGPSGGGKSTLLAAVAGLLKPHQGTIRLDGRVLFDSASRIHVPAHQRHIGLVFQDRQLLPHLSVRNNLLYGFHNIAPHERRFTLEAVVELLEIGSLLDRKPRTLSGGEQQRVALGRAILYSPQLLLLDEPLSALDERLKNQILAFLLRIKQECDIPMLYVTHAVSEVHFLADCCYTMEAGRLSVLQDADPVSSSAHRQRLMTQ